MSTTAIIILLLVVLILMGLALFVLKVVMDELDMALYAIKDSLHSYGTQLEELNKRTYDIQTMVRNAKPPTHE